MNIYVYTVEGTKAAECLGVLDTYKSFNFTKKFQTCGTWTLKGNFTQESRKMLQVGNLIYVNPKVCGIVHTVDFSTDEDGETTYTAYGFELKGILSYRIVWETYNHNLPAADWINGIVQENTRGKRRLFTTHSVPAIVCPNLDKQVSYKGLDKAVQDACAAQNTIFGLLLGYDVTCDVSEGFTFSLLEGADRTFESGNPYLISRDMNNVSNLSFAESSKSTINVVKCGGEDSGTDRKFVTVGDDSLEGLCRKEAFNDAREIQSRYKDSDGTEQTLSDEAYSALLTQEAETSLVKDSISVDAESVVDSEQALLLLGAKITLMDKDFKVRTDDFITEVNFIDESDGQLTTITIGKGIEAKRLIV